MLLRSCCVLLLSLFSCELFAASFVVEDIEVRGIKKIEVGTVLNYLPVKVGEPFDYKRSPEVLRELYSTGFFDEIEILKEGNSLIVVVKERPAIARVNVKGNKEVTEENMTDALKQLGMTKGKTYNPRILEKLKLELEQLYYSLGKYAVRIEATATELDEDRIKIDLKIAEGAPAKIRNINITGNTAFDDETLLDNFELETTDSGLFASDKYSSVKLSGDLENLRSWYLDHGYLQFDIESNQVSITPDKSNINITVNIHEGDQYTVSKVNLTGDLIVPEEDVRARVLLRPGDIFSQKQLTNSTKLIKSRLGIEGYAYTEVNTLPRINEEDKTVELTILVTPGQKMLVRKIVFEGNGRTQDVVMRREMRQMEGEVYSTLKIERSKIRLQRLKFISSVDIRNERVSSENNLMDLYVSVDERFSGSFTAGIGYSEAAGAVFNLGLTNDNIFGTGNSLGITFNQSDYQKQYEVSFTDPFYTEDGISRTIALGYTKTEEEEWSDYLNDQTRASMKFVVPLSEYNSFNFSFGLENNNIQTSIYTSNDILQFIVDNNDNLTDIDDVDGAVYNTYFGSIGFSKDSRNRLIFPDSGHVNSIGMEVFGGELTYYRLSYRHQTLFSLSDNVTWSLKARSGYGKAYGSTSALPFYEKYLAGGVQTVRGYDYNSLGPLDSKSQPFGGNFQFITNSEFLFKMDAFGDADTFRLGLYLDAGNVFATYRDYETSELRASYGIAMKWLTAVGPIQLSYAQPFNDQQGDEIKNFQFSLGTSF